MRTWAQLEADDRGVYSCEPCEEYPGEWLVYRDGNQETRHVTLVESIMAAHDATDLYEQVSVCWKASDDDPRIGKVWFTPYYCVKTWRYYGMRSE